MYIPKENEYVVLKVVKENLEGLEIGDECVYWVNKDFPLIEYLFTYNLGYFESREPTEIEKEYCFNAYQSTGINGADLEDIQRWIEWKNSET